MSLRTGSGYESTRESLRVRAQGCWLWDWGYPGQLRAVGGEAVHVSEVNCTQLE